MKTKNLKMELEVRVEFNNIYKLNRHKNKVTIVDIIGRYEQSIIFHYHVRCYMNNKEQVKWNFPGEVPSSIQEKIKNMYTSTEILEIFKGLKKHASL